MTGRNIKLPGLAGLIALSATLAAGQAEAAFENVYSAGHADVNIGYEAGSRSLSLNYELATNAVINGLVIGSAGAGERDADTITVLLGDNALGTGPAGLPSPFAGNPLWTLPQNSVATRPFLGIGAEAVDPGVFRGDALTLTFTGLAQRPAGGEFILWQAGSESSPLFNSANGFTAADRVNVVAGGHDHYVFGFTGQGTYDLNFTASGTLLDGTVVSASETFRFQVGASTSAIPEPGSLALMGLGAGVVGLMASRRRGKAGPRAAG